MEAQNKYRAWHKVRKEMYNVHGWHSEYVFKDTLDGVGCDGNPDRLEDVTLMLCTEFKTQNNSVIYAGDVLRAFAGAHYWEYVVATVSNSKSNTLYAIEIFNNCTTDETEENYTYQRSNSSRGRRKDIEFLPANIEIIGNIYQNPELLK